MSIQQTIDSLKRAQAVVKASQPKAKRGMFALIEQRHTYVSLTDGHHAYTRFVPGIVTSISRDGVAQRVRVAGHGNELRLDHQDWLYCHVDCRGLISDPTAVVARLSTEHGVANEYDSLEAAQAAIKTAAAAAGLDIR
jgi:hypothetical protein